MSQRSSHVGQMMKMLSVRTGKGHGQIMVDHDDQIMRNMTIIPWLTGLKGSLLQGVTVTLTMMD